MPQHFDAIVVGAGGVGSASAYYLARAGQRVLLLEQFELNHQKGSSYGYSRVIRYTYDNPIYVELMRAAYPLWFELQAEAKEQLYVKNGRTRLWLSRGKYFSVAPVQHGSRSSGLRVSEPIRDSTALSSVHFKRGNGWTLSPGFWTVTRVAMCVGPHSFGPSTRGNRLGQHPSAANYAG